MLKNCAIKSRTVNCFGPKKSRDLNKILSHGLGAIFPRGKIAQGGPALRGFFSAINKNTFDSLLFFRCTLATQYCYKYTFSNWQFQLCLPSASYRYYVSSNSMIESLDRGNSHSYQMFEHIKSTKAWSILTVRSMLYTCIIITGFCYGWCY